MAPTKAVPPSDIEQVILEQTAPPFRGPGQKSEPSSCLYEVWTNGFVVIVTAAVFLIRPTRRLVLGALLSSMALTSASRSCGRRRATSCGPGGSSHSASPLWRCRRWCAMDGASRCATWSRRPTEAWRGSARGCSPHWSWPTSCFIELLGPASLRTRRGVLTVFSSSGTVWLRSSGLTRTRPTSLLGPAFSFYLCPSQTVEI